MVIRLADSRDREEIYRLRYTVYAAELGQHAMNGGGRLSDALDEFNVYLVAACDGVIAGFISITPPEGGRFSVDKYVCREDFAPLRDGRFHEIRLLTVTQNHRGREIAGALMYAAFRWVEAHNGDRIVAIGRREILDLYLHVGLERLGCEIRSGAVTYELLAATLLQIRAGQKNFASESAAYDWILSLDADEALSEALEAEIWHIKKHGPAYDAYTMPRMAQYLGRWILHSGWYPDRKVRLFNRAKAKWIGEFVHESAGSANGRT